MKPTLYTQFVSGTLLGLFSLTSSLAQEAEETKLARALIQPYTNSQLKELSDTTRFSITNAYVDKISGCTLVYAQQKQQGVRVLNTMLTLAFKQGKLVSKAGSFRKSTSPEGGRMSAPSMTLSTSQAIDKAQKHVLTNQIGDKSQSGLRFGALASTKSMEVVQPEWVTDKLGKLVLAWRVVLESVMPMARYLVHVDAQTGEVVQATDLIKHCRFGDATPVSTEMEAKLSKTTGAKKNGRRINSPSPPPTQAPVIAEATYNVVPFSAQNPLSPGGTPRPEKNPWERAGVGNLATPYGWHFDGVSQHDSLKGNNAEAYFFSFPSNKQTSLASTTPYPTLTFTAPFDTSQSPFTTANRTVGLTNLFYMTNIVHDVLYQYGFDEVSGNTQHDNLGRGGIGNDAFIVRKVDGYFNGGDISIPPDGKAPEMAITLAKPSTIGLSKKLEKIISVQSPAGIRGMYEGREYDFMYDQPNLLLHTGPISAQVTYYSDQGDSTHTGCTSPTNASALKGTIALLDYQAICRDSVILHNAQAAGAVAVLLAVPQPGLPPKRTGEFPQLTIPVVLINQVTGDLLKQALLKESVELTLLNSAAYYDGSLQNDIIAHEYTHIIATRLVGGPATPTCLNNKETLHEGYSDFMAMMLTTDWSKAKLTDGRLPYYVSGYAYLGDINAGIRNYPFSTDMKLDPRTYADVAISNRDVYILGGPYISAMWDMVWALNQREGINKNIYDANAKGGNSIGMKLVMTGMKLMPCGPGLLDGRNGILKADSLLYGAMYSDTIWSAFARRGMGLHANQGSVDSVGDEHVAFDTPLFLKDFSLSRRGARAHLTWTAYGRFVNYGFSIEKSVDSLNFTPVGSLTATTAQKTYAFSEPVASMHQPFYRIRYTNDLGQVHYSAVIRLVSLLSPNHPQLRIAGSDSSEFTTFPLTIYPNPNSGQFQARFWAPQGQPVRLELVDIQGHTVMERELKGEGTYQEVPLDAAQNGHSLLFLHLRVGTQEQIRKVFINQ